MIPYRVFKRGPQDALHYDASSQSLGEGMRELLLIVDGHQLGPGDVVELNGNWLFYNGLDAEEEFAYLPPYEDSKYDFGDGPWSMKMKARLQHEATVGEQLAAEARERSRRRR